jgi:predicted phage terminase large subunit-like protein
MLNSYQAAAELEIRKRERQTGSARSFIREDAEGCKRSLAYYIPRAWKIVEPVTPFVPNWHIGLISEYLTALTNLEIQNLIINIPPRHMKSLLTVVMWPTWVWINHPASRWMTGSYSLNLATRDALKSRRIIQSNWYQERFGDVFQLTGDQNVKSRYENSKTGLRMAFGMDTAFTGEGGDFIVVDDSLKAQDADSDVEREKVNETWDESLSTRANNPKTVRRVIIGQRLHQDDLPGHVIEKMKTEGAHQYEVLCLPARYEPKRFISGIGLKDPRQKVDELLWPEHLDGTALAAMEADLGERGTAGQLQQRPAPAGGLIFLRKWFDGKNRYDPRDRTLYNKAVARWVFYDTAFKDKESNDPTARVVFDLLPDYRILLREAWWDRMKVPQVIQDVSDNTKRWNYDEKLRATVVEDKGSGIAVLQILRAGAEDAVAKFLQEFDPGTVSKTERARRASPWCERDCILLPMPDDSVPWLFPFEELFFNFPAAKVDDPPDAFTMGVLYLENLLAEGWKLRLGTLKR